MYVYNPSNFNVNAVGGWTQATISAQIENRAAAYANDRVASMQYRHVSLGTCPPVANNYTYAPAGALIVGGYVSVSSITAVSALRYVYPQIYDVVRGWVGFSQAY
jgi:hypothetical protein